MKYGVVTVAAAPVRRKPNHRREMVNQLLFGDVVEVLKEKGTLWIKVKSLHDDYEGWITRNLLTEVKEDEALSENPYMAADFINIISSNGQQLFIPSGATLFGFNGIEGRAGQFQYTYSGAFKKNGEFLINSATIEANARNWLNTPYMWGGRTMFGIDCSGFVQLTYKLLGTTLPRDAWQQAGKGEAVKLKDATTGDLAFFDDKDEIVHVGILLSPSAIIHASGKVRIDEIDKKGIINSDSGQRSHRLKLVKRIF